MVRQRDRELLHLPREVMEEFVMAPAEGYAVTLVETAFGVPALRFDVAGVEVRVRSTVRILASVVVPCENIFSPAACQ